jgi:hypothetical protein
MHVVLVPNERVEALIRSLLDSFAASDGVPLRVVFDNPKTVVVRHEAGRPVWNAILEQVAIDYGFTIELCSPTAATLIAEEIAHRARTRLTRAVHRARFPFLRTIDDFSFTFQTTLKLQMLGSYLGAESSARERMPSSAVRAARGNRTL